MTFVSSSAARRRLRPEERRGELLAAARAQLAQGSLDSVTVPAIARRAGAAQGTFYRYFRDVEDVFVALLDERVVPRLMDLARSLDLGRPRDGGEVESVLRAWFLGLANLIQEEGPLLHAALTVAPHRPGRAAGRCREILEQMRAWGEGLMTAVNGQPPYRTVDPRYVSYIVLGMTIASITQATEDAAFEPEAWAREMAAFETWGLVQRGAEKRNRHE